MRDGAVGIELHCGPGQQDGALNIDLTDEVTAGTLVTYEGQIVHPRIRELLEMPPLDPPEPEPEVEEEAGEGGDAKKEDDGLNYDPSKEKRIPLAE